MAFTLKAHAKRKAARTAYDAARFTEPRHLEELATAKLVCQKLGELLGVAGHTPPHPSHPGEVAFQAAVCVQKKVSGVVIG